jgi:hypothetical protein
MQIRSVRTFATASVPGWTILPFGVAWAEQQSGHSPTIPHSGASEITRSQEGQPPTLSEHMEELRAGLERLARTYIPNT